MQHFQQIFLLLSILINSMTIISLVRTLSATLKNKFQRHLKNLQKKSPLMLRIHQKTCYHDKYNTKVFESALYVIFSNKKLLSSLINIYLTVRTEL
jgi:hypothetical protein